MKTEEIAAYVGAAAWLPQIAGIIYRRIVQPEVSITPGQYGEAGFTSFGPIFNLQLLFSVEKKDIVLDGLEMILQHTDGDLHILRWAGIGETFSEITDAAGNRQIVKRDQTPIAIKIGTESLIEKFVRFQEPKYHEIDRPMMANLLEHCSYLKQTNPTSYVEKALESKELFALIEARKKSFWWKPGTYEVTLKPSSPKKFKLANSNFTFKLTKIDIDFLKRNLSLLDIYLKNVISSSTPNFEFQPLNWNWANVDIDRRA